MTTLSIARRASGGSSHLTDAAPTGHRYDPIRSVCRQLDERRSAVVMTSTEGGAEPSCGVCQRWLARWKEATAAPATRTIAAVIADCTYTTNDNAAPRRPGCAYGHRANAND